MMDERDESPDQARARRDFVDEAEEILDTLSERLRDLESARESGRPHIDVIHTLFRDVHSLKGFAASLGVAPLTDLLHSLEDLLSSLRLGAPLDGALLDLLHETLDALGGTVHALRSHAAPPDLEGPRRRLAEAVLLLDPGDGAAAPPLDLPAATARSLTEFEERRLRICLLEGRRFWLLRARPDPERLREDLQDLAGRISPAGELVSTIPVIAGADGPVEFDLLIASAGSLRDLDLAGGLVSEVREITPPPPSRPRPGRSSPRRETPIATGDPADEGPDTAPATLRVPVERLDEMLAQVGDLSIGVSALERLTHDVLQEHPGDRRVRALTPCLRDLQARARLLQRGALEARLVPLDRVFRRLARTVARASRGAGREADLASLGGDTQVDKTIGDAITPSLMHLVTNALDHGIEPPDERLKVGKPRRGRLILTAFRRGPSVVIELSDDGRGIDLGAVRSAAEARGFLRPGEESTDEAIQELIFRPGLSTRAEVSDLSGRGVGLDVVRREIRRLKGRMEVRTRAGQGTAFTLIVPANVTLVPAIIVRSRGRRYAMPMAAIRENLRLDPARVRIAGGGEQYERPEGPLPLVRLERLLATAEEDSLPPGAGRYAIVAGSERPFGIVVDALIGRQEIVIKPVGRWLRDLPGVGGATDLGDAAAILVLDPDTLLSGESHAGAA